MMPRIGDIPDEAIETMLRLLLHGLPPMRGLQPAILGEAMVAGGQTSSGGTVPPLDFALVELAEKMQPAERRAAVLSLDIASEGAARPADDVRAAISTILSATLVEEDPVLEHPAALGEIRAYAHAMAGGGESSLEQFRLVAMAWCTGRAFAALRQDDACALVANAANQLLREVKALPDPEDQRAVEELLTDAIDELRGHSASERVVSDD